jgi:hypothetical protein
MSHQVTIGALKQRISLLGVDGGSMEALKVEGKIWYRAAWRQHSLGVQGPPPHHPGCVVADALPMTAGLNNIP